MNAPLLPGRIEHLPLARLKVLKKEAAMHGFDPNKLCRIQYIGSPPRRLGQNKTSAYRDGVPS